MKRGAGRALDRGFRNEPPLLAIRGNAGPPARSKSTQWKKKRRAAGAVAASKRSREDPTRWPIFETGSLSIPEKAANNRHRRDVGACLRTL